MKRTKYLVRHNGHVARFSSLRHAQMFAVTVSKKDIGFLVEVSAKDGLHGQYRGGVPTPEFEGHHLPPYFRNEDF